MSNLKGVYVMTEIDNDDSECNNIIGVYTSHEDVLKELNEYNTDNFELNGNGNSVWIENGATSIGFEYHSISEQKNLEGVYVMTESNYEDREYSVIGVYTSYEEALKFLNECNTDHCAINVNNGSTWIEMGVTYIGFEHFLLNPLDGKFLR